MASLPFDQAKLSEADRAIYEAMKAKRAAAGAPFAGPYLALMNHPQLTEKIEALGYYLKFEGRLPREVYQYLVLRTARACDVPFEWVDHVDHAREAGVPETVIEALRTRAPIALPEPYATAEPVIAAALAWQDVPEDCSEQGGRPVRPGRSRGARCPRRLLPDVLRDQPGLRGLAAAGRGTTVLMRRLALACALAANRDQYQLPLQAIR